jgi:hypothetical protein
VENLAHLRSAFLARRSLGSDFLPQLELMLALGATIFVNRHVKILGKKYSRCTRGS